MVPDQGADGFGPIDDVTGMGDLLLHAAVVFLGRRTTGHVKFCRQPQGYGHTVMLSDCFGSRSVRLSFGEGDGLSA